MGIHNFAFEEIAGATQILSTETAYTKDFGLDKNGAAICVLREMYKQTINIVLSNIIYFLGGNIFTYINNVYVE